MWRAVFLVVLVVGALGCKQGEGSRCDKENGNDDCASGLTCQLNGTLCDVKEAYVCCPASGTSNVEGCKSACENVPLGDSSTPVDSASDSVASDTSDSADLLESEAEATMSVDTGDSSGDAADTTATDAATDGAETETATETQ
jgi:hypothetical protein